MGNTDSKKTSKGPLGQHTTVVNNSPSYSVQDGFHLFQLHGCIALRETNERGGTFELDSDEPHSRTNTYFPPQMANPHQWVNQQALDLRLMEQQCQFEMLFRNAMRTQQTARVGPMMEPNYHTYFYRSGKPSQRWPDQIIPQAIRPETPDQNLCHNTRAPEDMV